MSDYAKVFKELGIGLSRFLRYAYGSFLLFFLALIMKPTFIQETFKDIDTSVLVLGMLVVGAGIYVFHRGLVIPIHHLIGCWLFKAYDFCSKTDNSSNPVAILKTWGVPKPLKIVSYTILRSTPFFDEMQKNLNLEHAQNGLLVMTSEGMFAAILFSARVQNPKISWPFLLILGIIFLVCSYPPAFVLHSLEGRFMRQPERARKARQHLREAGIPVMIDEPEEDPTLQQQENTEQVDPPAEEQASEPEQPEPPSQEHTEDGEPGTSQEPSV